MSLPTVVNQYKIPSTWRDDDQYLYIGRGSKWGNPFRIGKDGDRTEVIQKYREYIKAKPELMAALPELMEYQWLVCFCKPQPCHGDVLLELLTLHDLEEKKKRLGWEFSHWNALTQTSGRDWGMYYHTAYQCLLAWSNHGDIPYKWVGPNRIEYRIEDRLVAWAEVRETTHEEE